MKQKLLKNQAVILTATLLAVGCAIAAPGLSSSTSSQEPGQMTSELPAARQSLREIFANPDDWEVHLYTFPREIRTYAPLTAAMLREKGSDVHYQHLADGQAVAAALMQQQAPERLLQIPIRFGTSGHLWSSKTKTVTSWLCWRGMLRFWCLAWKERLTGAKKPSHPLPCRN